MIAPIFEEASEPEPEPETTYEDPGPEPEEPIAAEPELYLLDEPVTGVDATDFTLTTSGVTGASVINAASTLATG